jgi:hypothetical protein
MNIKIAMGTMLEKLNANKNIVILCLTVIVICLTALTWRRIGTPERVENHVVNKYDQSHNQWQATMVFPNQNFPFTYSSFTYEAPSRDLDETWEGYTARLKTDLDSRCTFWYSALTVTGSSAVINCYKVKKESREGK